jgi:uncharacterized protein (DUF885 family)
VSAPTDPVHLIADDYVVRLAEHEPDAAQAIDREDGPDLPDLSPAWLQERYTLQGEVIARLDALAPETGDRALRSALRERMERERLLFDTGFTPRLVAGLATPIHLVRYAVEGLTLTSDAAGEALLRRVEAAPVATRQYIESLRWAREHTDRFLGGGVAPVRQLDTLAAQVERWVETDWFGAIPVADDVDAAARQRLRDAADATNAALAALVVVLRDELRPVAPTVDGVGVEVYPSMSAAMLGADIDLGETYAWGWSELARLVTRSRELATELGGSGDDPVRAAAALLDADPRYRLDGIPAIRDWLRVRVAETTGALADVFDLPDAVDRVECVVSEASSGVVYYTPAPPDGSAPSRIVWTIPSGVPVAATWQEVTSVHHEGLPGHHLQFVVTASDPGLHPWQRHLCHIHGYAEGWAHYAEQLADELGLIRDPAERLGLLLGQIWRTVRIVADIGLHTGWPVPEEAMIPAQPWTPALAQELLERFALVEPALAGFEVDRYLGWPGQALAFRVGARLWTQARDAREVVDGEAFSLRRFHRDALALGPMGLDPLRERLLG